jgi:hypothetical protein
MMPRGNTFPKRNAKRMPRTARNHASTAITLVLFNGLAKLAAPEGKRRPAPLGRMRLFEAEKSSLAADRRGVRKIKRDVRGSKGALESSRDGAAFRKE